MLTGNPEAFTILKSLTLWAELPLEVATILGRKNLMGLTSSGSHHHIGGFRSLFAIFLQV
jgi:hypothetical protein